MLVIERLPKLDASVLRHDESRQVRSLAEPDLSCALERVRHVVKHRNTFGPLALIPRVRRPPTKRLETLEVVQGRFDSMHEAKKLSRHSPPDVTLWESSLGALIAEADATRDK